MREQLIREFSRRLSIIEEKGMNINYGGCGIFAYILGTNLAKHGIQSSIAIFSSDWILCQYEAALSIGGIMDPEKIDKPTHVMVNLGSWSNNMYIDSIGVGTLHEVMYHYLPVLEVSLRFFRPAALTRAGWRENFHRTSDNIRMIRRHIRKECAWFASTLR